MNREMNLLELNALEIISFAIICIHKWGKRETEKREKEHSSDISSLALVFYSAINLLQNLCAKYNNFITYGF